MIPVEIREENDRTLKDRVKTWGPQMMLLLLKRWIDPPESVRKMITDVHNDDDDLTRLII
jgi:hypothetical protein